MFKSVIEFPNADDDIWTQALHCYICTAVHTRAIFLCENGHLICQKCAAPPYYSSSSSTRCSCSKKVTKVRAEYLENIVRATRFHCEHECGQALTNEEYAFHVEEACRFRPINCPLALCRGNTLVDYNNYLRHLRRVHNVGTFDLDENGEAQLQITPTTEPMYITMFDEKTFFLRWEKDSAKFWVQSFQNSRGISVQVEALTFRCNIRISKAHSGLNCPDTDVVRLVMNERVRLKFNALSDEIWTGPPSASGSNRNSAVSPTAGSAAIRNLTSRASAMSITSSSSDGTGAEREQGSVGATLDEEELPPPTPPPLPEVEPPTA